MTDSKKTDSKKTDLKKIDSKKNLIGFGDSSLRGCNQHCFEGYTTEKLIAEAKLLFSGKDDIKYNKCSKIFIASGTNDLGHGMLPEEVINKLKELWNLFRTRLGTSATIYVFGVLELSKQHIQLNDLIRDFILSTDENYEFIDFFNTTVTKELLDSDGLHLNKKGQALLQTLIESGL
jgi:hypothetical protein